MNLPDSCFDCNKNMLCFMFRDIQEQVGKSGILNIDGDSRPGNWSDIFKAVGSACKEFERAED